MHPFVFTQFIHYTVMSHSNEFPGSKFLGKKIAQPFPDLLNMTSLAQEVSFTGFSFIVDKRQTQTM